MSTSTHTISVKGKPTTVPALKFGEAKVIVEGKHVRIASVHDEEWLETGTLPDPREVLLALETSDLKADIFSFTQHIPHVQPQYPFEFEWENSAVIRLTTYEAWWESLPQVARRNVRTAQKKKLEARVAPFDDAFIRGIMGLYNEAPVRLGKKFWHYGKDFETVKRENGTFLDRSEFIGAYLGDELVGFIKLVYIDNIGSMMQILAMVKHQDKRTTNLLIAKAVEVCIARGKSFMTYCRFIYGKNDTSLLTDFKARNGFEKMDFPRYYVPLTRRGRIALALQAHHGIKGMMPAPVLKLALQARTKFHDLLQQASGTSMSRSAE